MVNRYGSSYMIRIIVLCIILGILSLVMILLIGVNSVEDMETFFGEKFRDAIGVNSNLEPKLFISVSNNLKGAVNIVT